MMPQSQELRENYERCYGKTNLKFGSKPVLIVVDVCKAYHDPSSPLYAPERFDVALKSIIRLIETCRAVGIRIVFTSVLYENGSGGKCLRDFAPGAEPKQNDVVITKQYASSFFGTSLCSTLTSWGCDSTIICGYSTSGCVRATALDSMQYGFSPFIPREACGDRHQSVNDSNLFDMNSKFAEVMSEEDIMTLINGLRT